MTQSVNDIILNISTAYDPEQIIDTLGWGSEELVENLWGHIEENIHLFQDVYLEEENNDAD